MRQASEDAARARLAKNECPLLPGEQRRENQLLDFTRGEQDFTPLKE